MSEKVLMKGNEAIAEAAIRCGCRYYFGYPITPQNEIPEYLSRELQKVGGYFVQAESELAAINMAYGGAAAGGRVFVSSSSPGIALMQEGFSFLCSTEMPLVILNVSRGGPGVGGIQPAQADYYQATRGGGNGDYHLIVYAPASIQEAVDMMANAFRIAEEYNNPMMLLADGLIGQMMEPIILPESISDEELAEIQRKKTWALTGTKEIREHNVIKSLDLKPEELEQRILDMERKYIRAKEELVQYETLGLELADVVMVAYGSTARIAEEAKFFLPMIGHVGLLIFFATAFFATGFASLFKAFFAREETTFFSVFLGVLSLVSFVVAVFTIVIPVYLFELILVLLLE